MNHQDGGTEQVIRCMLAMQRHPWEQGVCMQALYEADRPELWLPMAYDAVKRMSADGRLAMVGGGAAVSDPAACGEVCLRAYEKTGDGFYRTGAERMLDYLMHRAPRTKDGIICHNEISFEEGFSAKQLWIDGLYMVPPFLAVMGRVREAAEQIAGYTRHLFDSETGLFFHIVDTEQGRFVRKKRWATGNGWALLGLIRTAEEAQKQGDKEIAALLADRYRKLLQALLRYQLPDGRFHDILDDPTSFVDGTSAMMTAAAIWHGIYDSFIPAEYGVFAERAFQTVTGTIDGIGLIHQVCGCPDFTAEGTSAKAQASYVMAAAWRSRCGDGSSSINHH